MAVTLRLPKNTRRVNPSVFNKFILKHIGEEHVEILRPLARDNEWELRLKIEAIREKLLRMGKTKIKRWICWIYPFCSLEVRGYIHWLPNAISNDTVKEFLSQYGQVLFVENRTPPNWNSTIANESRYYALYLEDKARRWDIPHFKKFDNFLCLITVRGRKPACFHCRAWGHKKSQCKAREIKFNSYCRKPHCSESSIRNEEDNVNVIGNEVETISAASSSTITTLADQQVGMESEPSIAISSTSVIDSTSEVCIKSEATVSSSFITNVSLTLQACTENEPSTALISLPAANGTSQICSENEPSSSTTASFVTPQVLTEGEPAAASSSTTASFVTPQVLTEGEPAAASTAASSSTTASFVTPQVLTEGEPAAASSSTASFVTPVACTESKQDAASISNSATPITPEVCIEKKVNVESSSISSTENTSHFCIENEGTNKFNSLRESVSPSRVCFVWKPTDDDDIKMEKQIFLAIHYLGKWKKEMDELTESLFKYDE
ncbi:CCHC-type domain-containing protein [Trichonephila inaurata madagascariensis]|uniref:CCHC-type domain-containing protein n=1 Tax=Trichonephila inaurata madagascariensis TaxID=2747483 RepID=A0A8X6X4F7_9ARAC|nr:CCHC-type domain-containing protein [Trichonephila inaurata madagascariensis]